MCGIIGHVAAPGDPPERPAVERGMARLAHRGPDGSGLAVYDRACLGHRRLSVIDPQLSAQPWRTPDGRYCLVFNGEIYNYVELRRELEKCGHKFRSEGDTEVLMEAYVEHGLGCLGRLNGMFAFAIWDEHEHTLVLARDRLGKKPLYYAPIAGGVAFASELAALTTFSGIDTEVDPSAVHDYFAYQFIPGDQSIYRGVRRLLPAHSLVLREGAIRIQRYWSPPLPQPVARPEEELCEELRALIGDAVRLRLRSDVPLGSFLSGGLDSAVIATELAALGADLDTFTIGFPDSTFDERPEARVMAGELHSRHHEQLVSMDAASVLPECLRHFGEPFADPSALPTWYLSRHAREHVTVALSGDGGDELFGGYRRYQAIPAVRTYQRLPRWLRSSVIDPLLNAVPETDVYYGAALSKKIRLGVRMAQRLAEAPHDLLPQTFSPSERRALFSGHVPVRAANHVGSLALEGLDTASQMMLTDIQTYLAEDILTKVDRMSMAHALEVRAPLLDYRIVEFACRLPTTLKVRGLAQKYLLRRAYAHRLPSSVAARPKHGFAVPVSRWLREELSDLFCSAVLDASTPAFLDRAYLSQLWKEHRSRRADHGFKLWSLLVYCLWDRSRTA